MNQIIWRGVLREVQVRIIQTDLNSCIVEKLDTSVDKWLPASDSLSSNAYMHALLEIRGTPRACFLAEDS